MERDENGLVVGYDYKYDGNDRIDWRASLDPKWLYPNPSSVERGHCKADDDVTTLPDKHLCILLGGLREIAKVRGYVAVDYDVHAASKNYFSATCQIMWIANKEDKEPTMFADMADVHEGNVKGFGKNFLAAFAANRAFGRCVRAFLGINIVSDVELGDSRGVTYEEPSSTVSESSPKELLKKLFEEEKENIKLDKVRAILKKYGFKGQINSLEGVFDINETEDGPGLFGLVRAIKKAQDKRKKC